MIDLQRLIQIGICDPPFGQDDLEWALAEGVRIITMDEFDDLGRDKGLLCAVEIVADKTNAAMLAVELGADDRIRQKGMQEGLLICMRRTNGGQFGEWFMVAPPLTISLSQIDDMMDRVERTLERYAAEVRRAGAIR